MRLGTKERILAIRLLEKLQQDPAYAEMIGVSVSQEKCSSLPAPVLEDTNNVFVERNRNA